MFTYLQRKLGLSDLTALMKEDHQERHAQWEVVTAQWKELYHHLQKMEIQMQKQQAPLHRSTLTNNAAPEVRKAPQSEKVMPAEKWLPRQATLEFYDRILKHLPRVRSLHLATLAERLKCSRGRVSGSLSRLLAEGKVERTGKGLYRAIRTEGEK